MDEIRRIRELSSDPGEPALDDLTQFVSAVHVRLFGVARDRARPLEERVGAVTQLGREAEAAGAEDPKNVRPLIRELLDALEGPEVAEPDAESDEMRAAIDGARAHC